MDRAALAESPVLQEAAVPDAGPPEPDRAVIQVQAPAMLVHDGAAVRVAPANREAVKDGRIKRGDLVLMEAMGGGLTWGAGLVRW